MKQTLLNTGHAHSDVVTIEMMPRTDYCRKKNKLSVFYSYITTPFGRMWIASTAKGICLMGLGNDEDNFLNEILLRYPNILLTKQSTHEHKNVRKLFSNDWSDISPIHLYIRGTDFQIKVWNELLKIPVGKISTYGEIAKNIGRPKSSRPVGNAISKNPIVYLIPCHRVICSSGKMGGFYWGVHAKLDFLNKESHSTKKINGYTNWEPTLF